ncbi:M1 family aminopeptidase [Flavobacterium sp.]|uniref:M1 family aminopeptidase n=1 Tax=Flavobacterium sp. TaxID=239 RepID=UPI002624EDAD|nr:M1 family aminopeptidase [Flavobacterium sp.]
MWKFIRHELNYWLKTPMVWIFFFINALLVFFAVASDNVSIGGGVGNIHKNAPFVIERYYAVMSIIGLLMTTAFMNATANRDFQYGMHQFIFSSPIKKRDYFFGKFIGASIVSIIPMLGVSLGLLLGPILAGVFDMAPAERFGPIIWSGHWYGILAFAIPNVIIAGVLLYGLAIIFRSSIVSFIGSMLILVFYAISSGFTRDIQKEWLANILDPFGIRPFNIMTKYLTVGEKNTLAVTLHDGLLYNRLLWLGICLLVLFVIYARFSFNTKKEKVKKTKIAKNNIAPELLIESHFEPTKANIFSLVTFWKLVKFETKAVIKNPTFIIIVAIGLINLTVGLVAFTGTYGTDQYPVTYSIVDTINDSFFIFIIGFIAFYTGVLVWKERDAKINEIQDATPIPSGMLFISKVLALIIALAIMFSATILMGIVTQTAYGYYHYELDVYIKSLLVIKLMGFAFMIVLSLLFHYLINNRYIAYFAFVAFIVVNSFIWGLMEINSNMLSFGSRPDITYSDMNKFGPFVPSTIWFNIYWALFCLILGFVINAFYIRGKELQFQARAKTAKNILRKNYLAFGASIIAFLLCAGFVFYNTKILNTYDSEKERENKQVEYEKKYKKFEHLVQPRFYKFDYKIDIVPEERGLTVHVDSWARNISNTPIKELHFTMPMLTDSVKIDIKGAKLKSNDKRLLYRIYTLEKPLAPNDSLQVKIDLVKENKGFENEVSFTQLTQNGTFFSSAEILPSFGYNTNYEISDKNERVKLKLPQRLRMPKLNENDMVSRANTYMSSDADWVEVNTTISTSSDQTAIAPGSLLKSWKSKGRNYFQYKVDQKSLNFYSFISARYEVARKKWNGIDLEVYYDKEHAYNVPNMLKSMQKSLEYYTANFGPYYHKQCRIIEFPRYSEFAQAFPGTMPFSEGIGFIIDLRDVTKDDIDQVYYVVAHEMGHQYWAHQVMGANMQGSEMMTEGFAQYSALMVMEKEYGKDKMKKFLEYEMNSYLRGRGSEFEGEQPLMKTENQQYIHYNKASVVMYYLKELIGEKNVNQAMKNLVTTYAYKNPPYPTSIVAVNEFKKVTPDSLQYVIKDMFETITLFSNRMLDVSYKKIGNEYEVTLKTTSEKFRSSALGKETEIPVADYIDIAVFGEPKDDKNLGKPLIYKRVKITKKENTFVLKTKVKPYQAGIDPYNYLIDRVPDDNLKKL